MSLDQHNQTMSKIINHIGFAFVIALLCLSSLSWQMGVWEPWESNISRILGQMWEKQTWLQVQAVNQGQTQYIPELPFGYWLSAISFGLFKHEFAMRFPSIVLVALMSALVFQITKEKSKQGLIAWIALFAFLVMPSVSYSARFLIGGGLGWIFCGLSILFYLRAFQVACTQQLWLGSFFLILAGLSHGLIGFLIPFASLIYARTQGLLSIKQLIGICGTAIVVFAIALWRLSLKQPEDLNWVSLLILQDPIHFSFLEKNRPAFQSYTHLIGFGLFPIAALLPSAFAYLLSRFTTEAQDQTQNSQAQNSQADHSTRSNRISEQAFYTLLGLSFCLGFLLPAILASFTGAASFLAAPVIAIAVAIYLQAVFNQGESTLVPLLTTILFLALLDSNLKHDPRYYIESLVGQKIDDFPSELKYWKLARLLNFALLGTLIAYQSNALRILWHTALQLVKAPKKPALHWLCFLISSIFAIALIFPYLNSYVSKWAMIEKLVESPFLSALSHQLKIILIFVIAQLFMLAVQYVLWAFYVRSHRYIISYQSGVEEEALEAINPLTTQLWIDILLAFLITFSFMYPYYAPGLPQLIFIAPLMRVTEVLPIGIQFLLVHLLLILLLVFSIKMLQLLAKKLVLPLFDQSTHFFERINAISAQPITGLRITLLILILWTGFSQLVIGKTLTAHFSQKSLIDHYEQLKSSSEEGLYVYQLTDAKNSFYLRDQKNLTAQEFKELSLKNQRFFALIDRKNLSQIDKEFRGITKQTLPVLNNQSYKMLLISNQIKENEEDFNPIKKALLKELPKDINQLPEPINFEDQIELVGWSLDPFYPKSGSQLKISLFWKAKQDVRTNWKVFVHIDSMGQRIHGDHEMVEGLFPTSNWKKGDLIRDDHVLMVKRGLTADRFKFYAGLYQGSTRMKIKNTNANLKDNENRALIGHVSVK